RHITLGSRDLVAVFASPSPGNEKLVSNTINRLYERGCEVIYDRDQQIHVSGHASIEELKMMISMVRPRYFIPVHGEYRHLVRHAQLASDMDIPQKNIFVLQNGDALSITPKKATSKQGAVQAGGILVDGMALGEMQGSLLRERRDLSEDGLVALSIMLDRNWRIVSPPVIESIGFIHMSDARELRDEIRAVVEDTVKQLRSQKSNDLQLLETRLRSRVRALLKRYSKTYPVILPLISAAENE
ncbi:MAG: ribonuclease J, partial [Synergistota bacterium]|nr:ribonuclease J [Synergistota bacterium]